MEFNTENFHDTYIISVFEDTETDELTMEIDFPVNWHESEYEIKNLIFKNAFNYQIHEIRFQGKPQMLEIQILEKQEDWTRFRINTNAGLREISCDSVELTDAK